MLLGFRCLRESRYYGDDLMVLRAIGLKQLPAVSTISRQLSWLDESSVQNLEALRSEQVLDRLTALDSSRITLELALKSSAPARLALLRSAPRDSPLPNNLCSDCFLLIG